MLQKAGLTQPYLSQINIQLFAFLIIVKEFLKRIYGYFKYSFYDVEELQTAIE